MTCSCKNCACARNARAVILNEADALTYAARLLDKEMALHHEYEGAKAQEGMDIAIQTLQNMATNEGYRAMVDTQTTSAKETD